MNRRARAAEGKVASWLRLALSSALWSFVAVMGLSLGGLLVTGGSYAGASDERVESFAANTYSAFLGRVGMALLKLAFAEWVVVGFVVLGLVHIASWLRRRGRTPMLRRENTNAVLALVVTFALVGFGAAMHPGLFLALLAQSRIVSLWATACIVVTPALALLGVVGHFVGAARGRRAMQLLFIAAAALAGAAAGRVRGWERRFTPRVFAIQSEGEPEKRPVSSSRSAPPSASASASPSASSTFAGLPSAAEKWGPNVARTKGLGPPARRPASILWIAIDSLRPDHIDPKNTPNLAKLVSESIYFPNTITPVPRTGPSWASAMTSLEPLTTGIETMFPDQRHADLSAIALPSYLGTHGYRTAVVSEYAGEFFRRINVGFDVEAVPRAELMQISGQMMLGRAPPVLAEAGLLYAASAATRSLLPSPLGELIRGMPNFSVPSTLGEDVHAFLKTTAEPTFVLAFYSQPHFPYTSSPKYARRYRIAGSDPSLAYGRDVASERSITSDADRRQIDALYRAALAESDEAVGVLLDDLSTRGWLDDAIVVLTADHGEGLYECPECVGHGDNLRGMMTLRVPLALRLPPKRFPGATPSVQSGYASLLDVYPTLLDLLGLEKLEVHEGMSLLDGRGALRVLPSRTILVETGEWLWTTAAVPKDRIDYPPITTLARLDGDRIAIDPTYEAIIRAAKHRAVIRAPYKLVYEPSSTGVRWRLFDIDADPLDTNDLAAQKPDVLADLKDALRRSVARHAKVLPLGDYFLTKPPGVPEDHW